MLRSWMSVESYSILAAAAVRPFLRVASLMQDSFCKVAELVGRTIYQSQLQIRKRSRKKEQE